MDLALNNLQKLKCIKPKQATNQITNIVPRTKSMKEGTKKSNVNI